MKSGVTNALKEQKPPQWNIFFVLLVVTLSFMAPLSSPPGIDQPTAIGAYLNGVFPTEAPGVGEIYWDVEPAFPNLTFVDPLAMVELPDQSGFYVVSKVGRIWKISADPSSSVMTSVLDISSRVDTDGDAGFTNIVLHPEFGQPGSPNRAYLYATYRYHPNGEQTSCDDDAFIRVSRFAKMEASENFDPNSELVLIQQFDTHCWHNGGGMFFGPEGFLYITVGDAGGANDQFNTGQQIDRMLLGGMLRIDVDKNPSTSHPIRRQPVDPVNKPAGLPSSFTQEYFIPNDNPWLDPNGGILEEFYAIGLRSPHRATYDPPRDEIWLGDVGQASREEISLIEKGGNYQWPYREGSINGPKAKPNPLIGLDKPPVYDYGRAVGNSVIGGFIYRGDKYASTLSGRYLFADHGLRNIWTLNPDNGEVVFLANVPGSGVGDKNGISSFATDSEGEVYILKLYGTNENGGRIYKLKQTASSIDPPHWLSQTGAFSELTNLTPAPGLVPFKVNTPLWSDRAVKNRWIALPNDGTHDNPEEQISFSATSEWQFPPGTVFIKHFELPVDERMPVLTKKVETRFIVRTEDGGVYGLTYKWNDLQTDAELLPAADTKDFTITSAEGSQWTQTWEFPGRTDCLTCHNANAGFILGVKTWQLNGDYTYLSGTTDNQLNTWRHLGMFANPFLVSEIPDLLKSIPLEDHHESLEIRVRSYLDANCSNCHRPNGVNGAFDARFSVPLDNQNLLYSMGQSPNTPPGNLIVQAKEPGNSELWLRDHMAGTANAMPPLAKKLVDEQYIAVLTDWINSLPVCDFSYLSDLPWSRPPTNGWGPVELDSSNGETGAGDGRTLTINGRTFAKGLGVHANSEIRYDLNGGYERFQAFAGVDDETCTAGSVRFRVYADGVQVYESPLMTQADDAMHISIDVSGVDQLWLLVNDADGDISCDHGDWADAKLIACLPCEPGSSCDDGDVCTTNDRYDDNCNCSGASADSDFDGIPDSCDNCIGQYGAVCPSGDCVLADELIPSGIYAASHSLSASGSVAGLQQVIFQAGNSILLKPGFRVEAGGGFQGLIVVCENNNEITTPEDHRQISAKAHEQDQFDPLTDNVPREAAGPATKRRHQPKKLDVQVRPNPFRDEFTLFIHAPFPELKQAVIRIMDISGRIIYQRFDAPFDEDITLFPHNGWVNGVYLVQIRAGEYFSTLTIVKQ